MLTEKMETSVARLSRRSIVKAPRIASPPIASGRLAAVRPPKTTTSSTSTIGSDICSARPMSSLTWVVMSLLIASSPPSWTVEPRRRVAQSRLERVVGVHQRVVVVAGELEDGVGRACGRGDEPAASRSVGRPGRGGRLTRSGRQIGQVRLDGVAERAGRRRCGRRRGRARPRRRRRGRRCPRSGPAPGPTRCPGSRSRWRSTSRRPRCPTGGEGEEDAGNGQDPASPAVDEVAPPFERPDPAGIRSHGASPLV